MLGSSNTYNTPDNFEPIWVANLIRCASPPDNVPALRDSVRYPKPTLVKKSNLFNISFVIKPLISFSSLVSFNLAIKSLNSILRIYSFYLF